MSALVRCDKHGESEATFVCSHILDSLQNDVECGFLWKLEDDGEYTAVCTGCNEMPFEEWESKSSESIRMICYSCFMMAARLNGVSQSEIEAARQ